MSIGTIGLEKAVVHQVMVHQKLVVHLVIVACRILSKLLLSAGPCQFSPTPRRLLRSCCIFMCLPEIFNLEDLLSILSITFPFLPPFHHRRHRLAAGTSEKIQLGALVAAFQVTRDLIVNEAQYQCFPPAVCICCGKLAASLMTQFWWVGHLCGSASVTVRVAAHMPLCLNRGSEGLGRQQLTTEVTSLAWALAPSSSMGNSAVC